LDSRLRLRLLLLPLGELRPPGAGSDGSPAGSYDRYVARTLRLVALTLAALQVAVGTTYLVLSFFVGEIRGAGTVTDFRLPAYGVAIVATGMAGACLAAAALLLGRGRPWLASAGVVLGTLPGIVYSYPPIIHPAVLLLPVGLAAIWLPRRSDHQEPSAA